MQGKRKTRPLALGPRRKNGRAMLKRTIQAFPGGPVVKTSPSNAGGLGSIPGWGLRIPHASWPKNQNTKQKQCCKKLSKDLKEAYR